MTSFGSKQHSEVLKPGRNSSSVIGDISLSAFKLVDAISNKQLQHEKIIALTVSGNYIYLATQTTLQIFEEFGLKQKSNDNYVSARNTKNRTFTKLINEKEFKQAKNIKCMSVCSAVNVLLIVLNNGHILSMHYRKFILNTDQILPKHRTKNAEQIVAQFKKPEYRFAIFSKKNAYIFEWQSSAVRYQILREINIGDPCISALFYEQYLCYSTMRKGFIMNDIRTGNQINIDVPLIPNNVPRMSKIEPSDISNEYNLNEYNSYSSNEGFLLLQTMPNLSMFFDKNGKPAPKDTANWISNPVFVIDCATYMVAYLENNMIEVISLLDMKSVQTLFISGDKTNKELKQKPKRKSKLIANLNQSMNINMSMNLNMSMKNMSINVTRNSYQDIQERNSVIRGLFKTSLEHVIMYNRENVFALIPTPIGQQIEECIKYLRIEKGLQLLMKDNPTRDQLHSFHAEAGFALLLNLQWKRAMEHFDSSDIDPRDIIFMFPNIRLEKFEYEIQHPSAPQNCTIGDIINRVLIQKRKTHNTNVSKASHAKSLPKRKSLLMKTLKSASISSSASSTSDDLYVDDNCLEEERIEYLHGIRHLGVFLWKRRFDPASGFEITDAETLLCVDTALLKIYVQLTSEIRKLIKDGKKTRNQIDSELLCPPFNIELLLNENSENACLVSECEKHLVKFSVHMHCK